MVDTRLCNPRDNVLITVPPNIRPAKGGERFPTEFLKDTNVTSTGSLSSTACFTRTTFSIRAGILDGALGLFWGNFLPGMGLHDIYVLVALHRRTRRLGWSVG